MLEEQNKPKRANPLLQHIPEFMDYRPNYQRELVLEFLAHLAKHNHDALEERRVLYKELSDKIDEQNEFLLTIESICKSYLTPQPDSSVSSQMLREGGYR